MEKQYFSPEQDGFYGVYYLNPAPSSKAMIAMLGDSSDDYMAKSGVKTWPQVLKKRGLLTVIWIAGAALVAGLVVLIF